MIAEMLTCIALNVYYEARSEPLEGQYAVAHVVLNRVASPRFPDDACTVVRQGLEKDWVDASSVGTVTVSPTHQRETSMALLTTCSTQGSAWVCQGQYRWVCLLPCQLRQTILE